MRRVGSVRAWGAFALLLWAPRAYAPLQSIPEPLDQAVAGSERILCGTIRSVEERGVVGPAYPDVGFQVEGVLWGPQDLKGKDLSFRKVGMAWPTALVPLKPGTRCVLFLDGGKEPRIVSVAPAPAALGEAPKDREGVRRVLLGAYLDALNGEKDLCRRREAILAASSLATKGDADRFLPRLEDPDEWIRRSALAALLRSTRDPRYVARALEDLRGFFAKYGQNTRATSTFVVWSEGSLCEPYPLLERFYATLRMSGSAGQKDEEMKALLPLHRLIAAEAPDPGFRERLGFRSLCRLGERQDAPRLLQWAEDASPYLRMESIRAANRLLGLEPWNGVMEDFLQREKGLREAARKAAAAAVEREWKALGRETQAAAEALIVELAHPDFDRREKASAALEAMGWGISWRLEQALEREEDAEVQERLRTLLRAFGRLP